MGIRRLAVITALSSSLILTPALPAWAAGPAMISTGLTDGQFLGIQTTIYPRFAGETYGLDRLDVLIDGTVIGTRTMAEGNVALNGVTVKPPAAYDGKEVQLVVRATDYLDATTELTTSVVIDTTPPVLADFGPAANTLLPGQVTFTPTGLSSDVASVELLPPTAYGSQWPASKATAAPWALNWDNRGSHNTTVTVAIKVTDRAGNQNQYNRAYRIDNKGPYINLDYFPEVGTGPSRLSAWVTDDNGVDRLEWWIDGAVRSTAETFDYDFGKRDRTVPVLLKAWDKLGNLGTAEVDVKVDATAPAVTVLTPGTYVRQRGIVSRARVSDAGGVAYVVMRGGSKARVVNGAFESRISLAEGKRELVWEAVDTNGNMRVVRRTVIVDATAPTLKVTKAPKNKAKVKGTVKVTASSTDRFGVARVELLINGKVVATDYKAGYAFSINSKKYGKKFKVQLRAYDRAGNSRVTTARTWYR